MQMYGVKLDKASDVIADACYVDTGKALVIKGGYRATKLWHKMEVRSAYCHWIHKGVLRNLGVHNSLRKPNGKRTGRPAKGCRYDFTRPASSASRLDREREM